LPCKQPAWGNWTKIPAQLGTNLTPLDFQVYEFLENAQRKDLPWQDKAKAIYNIHRLCIQQAKDKWTVQDTADFLNLSVSLVSRYRQAHEALNSTDTRIKAAVQESPTAQSAVAVYQRLSSRKEDSKPRPKLGKPVPKDKPSSGQPAAPVPEPAPEPQASLASTYLCCEDFHTFAAEYDGEPFNFIHCDFPYGIGYNTGGNFKCAADTIAKGQYDDSEEVLWSLLRTLAQYQKSLVAPSAHIMFWFSQNHRRKIEDTFKELFKGHVHSHLMIWQQESKQTTPDPQRYGQRNYETALCVTFGDRKIVRPVHLAKTVEQRDKIHRSQKPVEMLSHFFSMFVDESSRVLDPTCGSGTSIIAAHRAGASRILGLEKDQEMFTEALRYVDEHLM